MEKPKLFRISTVPMSLNLLLKGQLEFLNEKFDVTAISGAGKDLDIVAEREGVKVHPIEMHREISLIQDFKSLWQLYRYFKKEKPDIIHSITPKAGLLSMIAGKLAGVPVRMHTFTGLIFPHKQGYMKHTLIIMDKILCRCATHLYPEGKGVKEDLLKYNITKKPLKIIANGNVNGIDLAYYDSKKITEQEKLHLKTILNIKSDDFVYVFVGRLVIDKGVRELVKAFDEISKKHDNVKLILVGPKENEHNPKKRKMFKTIRENTNIISVGYQEDVRSYFAISNVFVLPSYREGFPNAVLQANAMELPCIVSDISGCNEIIKRNYNGILVPKKNYKELAKALLIIYNDQTKRENMRNNTRISVEKKFSQFLVWDSLVNEYSNNLPT